MSFTQAEHLFAGVHELGLNDLFKAFFTARPRYLKYGSPLFVTATTAMGTSVPAVVFNGTTVQFLINLSVPTVDITPGGPPQFPAGPGEFVVSTRANFAVKVGILSPVTGVLQVLGLCAPVATNALSGNGTVSINVKKVEIVDITPNWLETLVENFMLGILQAALSTPMPFTAWTVGAFKLAAQVGPLAETDQIKLRGNAL